MILLSNANVFKISAHGNYGMVRKSNKGRSWLRLIKKQMLIAGLWWDATWEKLHVSLIR